MKYLGSKGRIIVGAFIAILVLGVDSALGVTTISNTIISGVTAFISSAADPADAGVLRLGNTETICWEASPAGTDVCVQADANEDLLLDSAWNNVNLNSNPLTNAVLGGSLNANGQTITALASLASNAGDPADAGVIRLGNAEQECWEASPAGTDQCIGNNTTEDFVWDTNWNNININSNPITNAVLGGSLNANGQTITSLASWASSGADPADAGIGRLANAEQICWEASPAGTDSCLTYDSSETLQSSFAGTFYDIPIVLDRNMAQTDVVSSTTETTVYSFSVPANIMDANRCLNLRLMGDVLSNVAITDTITWRLKFGGTTVYQDTIDHAAISASRHPVYVDWMHCNDDATNAQLGHGIITEGTAAGATTGIGDVETDEQEITATFQTAAGSIDTTLAQTIAVTITWDVSSASDSFQKEMAVLVLY